VTALRTLDVMPADWRWRIDSRGDYLALEQFAGEMISGFPWVQLYVRAGADDASYPGPFDVQPCLFGSARFGLHTRFLDEEFPQQAAAIIRAGFSQPNTLWFGFVNCQSEACEVILELSLLSGGTAVAPPTEAQLDAVRDWLRSCAPYVADRLDKFTFLEVPPLGGEGQ